MVENNNATPQKTADDIIKNARLRAKIITNQSREQYKAEIENLKSFIDRWNAFIEETVKSYPSDKTRKLLYISDMIKEILQSEDTDEFSSKEKIDAIYQLTKQTTVQNKSLYGVSDNGFNMEDVLNPKGELDLMALCKELGVTKWRFILFCLQ